MFSEKDGGRNKEKQRAVCKTIQKTPKKRGRVLILGRSKETVWRGKNPAGDRQGSL